MRVVEGVEGIATVKFDKNDIVRSKVVTDLVAAFERYENEDDKKN